MGLPSVQGNEDRHHFGCSLDGKQTEGFALRHGVDQGGAPGTIAVETPNRKSVRTDRSDDLGPGHRAKTMNYGRLSSLPDDKALHEAIESREAAGDRFLVTRWVHVAGQDQTLAAGCFRGGGIAGWNDTNDRNHA